MRTLATAALALRTACAKLFGLETGKPFDEPRSQIARRHA